MQFVDFSRRLRFPLLLVVIVSLGAGQAASAPTQMFWTDFAQSRIQSANLNGSNVQDAITGFEDPRDLAFDVGAGHLYILSSAQVYRYDIGGTQGTLISGGMNSGRGLALDVQAQKMYMTDLDNRILRANFDGSEFETLLDATSLSNPTGIALDVARGKMYWCDDGVGKVQRANLDGTGLEDVVTGLSNPQYLDLDLVSGKIYWTDRGADKIRRANLDGSEVEDLVDTGELPHGIKLDLDGGKMYWTDRSRPVIQRANLDGTGVEDLVTTANDPNLQRPLGIALVPEPQTGGMAVLLALGLGAIARRGGWIRTRSTVLADSALR